jgi:hypothetical protein
MYCSGCYVIVVLCLHVQLYLGNTAVHFLNFFNKNHRGCHLNTAEYARIWSKARTYLTINGPESPVG